MVVICEEGGRVESVGGVITAVVRRAIRVGALYEAEDGVAVGTEVVAAV